MGRFVIHTKRLFRRHAYNAFFYGSILVFLACVLWFGMNHGGGDALERLSYRLNPSAERAYAYGERHFDTLSRHSYDVELAEWYFTETARLDPEHPTVYHELARIAFLKGDFLTALSAIDLQILRHATSTPSSFYVRGLIEGYMGRYDDAVESYEIFLETRSDNWAALNDYAWVLLKANRPKAAHEAAARGLESFPENPWLLNTDAIALSEIGNMRAAKSQAEKAANAVERLSEIEWLTAYPGNDPALARQGIETLRTSILDNLNKIAASLGEE
jgi:tetratricopeptide (TPR) repeat protein